MDKKKRLVLRITAVAIVVVLSLVIRYMDSKIPPEKTAVTASKSVSVPINNSKSKKIKDKPILKEITEPVGNGYKFDLSDVPEYDNTPFCVLNKNVPCFSLEELKLPARESYSPLDYLGRCGPAFAVCGTEIMPQKGEKRGSIYKIKPTGWIQARYKGISGEALYNRCHLIGWQLSAENDNRMNLVTGTRYLNVDGMLPFENMVADFIREKNLHVAYRVTPVFEGNDLLCKGVRLEAFSIEDAGDSICFDVFCYNVQPDIKIDYKTGSSASNKD